MCFPWFAVPLLVLLWAIFFVILNGWGRLLQRLLPRLLRTETDPRPDPFETFWFGWAILIPVLQLWHLFFPIDSIALFATLLIGIGGWVISSRRGRSLLPRPTLDRLFTGILLGTAFFVAYRSLGPLRHYDTGFYHLSNLLWIRSEAAVPGLGNLHGRLAFNSGFTLWAALCDVVPGLDARNIANGMLLAVLSIQIAFRIRQGDTRLLDTLLVGPLLVLILGPQTASLSTDAPVFILHILIFWEVLKRRSSAYLVALAAAAVMVKLSAVVFAGFSLILVLAVRKQTLKTRAQELFRTFAFGLLLVTPWMVHHVVLSGHLAYPVAATALDLEWTVPRALVLDEANFVRGFARSRTDHWAESAEDFGWLGTWWRHFPDTTFWMLVLGIAGCCVGAAGALLRRRPGNHRRELFVAFLPTLLYLVWWFLTAPDPRFAGASFGLFLAVGGASALREAKRGLWIAAFSVLLLVGVQLAPAPKTGDGETNDGPFCELPTKPFTEFVSDTGSLVRVPDEGQQCWTIELPCTPYFRPGLIARGARRGDGYRLDPTFTYGDMETVLPYGFEVSPGLGVQLVSGWRKPRHSGGLRVFGNAGRFLLFADPHAGAPGTTSQNGVVRLTLKPHELRSSDEVVERLGLSVLLNGREVFRGELRTNQDLQIKLPLRPDWNDVALRLENRRDAAGFHRDTPIRLTWP